MSGNPECELWQQGIGCQLCQRLMEKIRSWTGSIKPAAARIWDKMYGKILLCKITDLYGGIRLENIHQTAAHVILAILKYEQNGPIRLKKNWNNVTISPIKILPPHGAGYMEKGYEAVREIFNECSRNQMRDVFVEELQIEDLDAFIKDKYKDEDMSYEKTILEDGTVIYDILTSQIKQRYSFTEI